MITDTKNNLFWKGIAYAYYVYFASFPFIVYNSFLFGGTSSRSVNLIVFSAVLGLALAGYTSYQKGRGLALAKSPLLLALFVYFLALIISGIQGLNWGNTFWSVATRTTGIWYLLSLGLFMLVLWNLMRNPSSRDRLILVVTTSVAMFSLTYLLSARGFDMIFPEYRLDAFTFGNSSFAAMYLFGAFLLALYYLAQAKFKKWWMYVLPVLLLVNPALVNWKIFTGDFSGGLLGEARASSIAVFLSILMLGVLWLISKIQDHTVRTKVSWGLFTFGAIVAAAASLSLLNPAGYVRELYLSQGTAARPLVWELSEKAIGQRPVFGWGADNFERVFEKNIDNRLLQSEHGSEAWFDRAHNVYIDQMLDNGKVGLILYLFVFLWVSGAMLYSALNAREREDRLLAAMLLVYFPLHLAELQTAFDTSISYPMLGLMFVLAGVVFNRAWYELDEDGMLPLRPTVAYIAATVVAALCLWSLLAGAIPFIRSQIANGDIRTAGSAEKRLPLYPTLFSAPVDVQAFLWRTSTDFQRGIGENPKHLEDPKRVEGYKKELVVFENGYRDYLKENPTHFRAHLNLADILIYQKLFDVDKLKEAQEVLDKAIVLVPQSPQPYWMKAVAYVYMRQFDLAREYAAKGLELNPQVIESQKVVKYVEDSIRTFPEINLFFFRQI